MHSKEFMDQVYSKVTVNGTRIEEQCSGKPLLGLVNDFFQIRKAEISKDRNAIVAPQQKALEPNAFSKFASQSKTQCEQELALVVVANRVKGVSSDGKRFVIAPMLAVAACTQS